MQMFNQKNNDPIVPELIGPVMPGEAKSRGWVGRGWAGRGSWVVGRVCLKIKKKIYISSLSARSKFAIARSRINFPELLL